MKVCNQCKQQLSLEAFHKQSDGVLGRQPRCIACNKAWRTNYEHTKRGLVHRIYSNQKLSIKQKGYVEIAYSEEELFSWLMANPEFHKLHQSWVDTDYQTKSTPSCDRLNDRVSYTLDNLRLVTWDENRIKLYLEKMSGDHNKTNKAVDMLTMEGTFVKRIYSVSEAARQVNGSSSMIFGALKQRELKRKRNNGSYSTYKQQSAYGYKWRYSNIPNETAEIR